MTDNHDLRRQAADAIHRHRCNPDCPHGPIRYDYAEADAVLTVVADWLESRTTPWLTDQIRKAIG